MSYDLQYGLGIIDVDIMTAAGDVDGHDTRIERKRLFDILVIQNASNRIAMQ